MYQVLNLGAPRHSWEGAALQGKMRRIFGPDL